MSLLVDSCPRYAVKSFAQGCIEMTMVKMVDWQFGRRAKALPDVLEVDTLALNGRGSLQLLMSLQVGFSQHTKARNRLFVCWGGGTAAASPHTM